MILVRAILPPITHLAQRKLEWGVACAMVGWCVVLAQPNETMTQPQFAVMRQWATEDFWTWLCGLIGIARLAALCVNGAWTPSPLVRAP